MERKSRKRMPNEQHHKEVPKYTLKPTDNYEKEVPNYKPQPTDTYDYEGLMFKFWIVLGLLTFSAIIAVSVAMYNDSSDADREATAREVSVSPVAVAEAAPEPELTADEIIAAAKETKRKRQRKKFFRFKTLKKAIGETKIKTDVNSNEAIVLYVGVMNEASRRAGAAGQFGDPAVTEAALKLIATVKKRQMADLPELRRKWAMHLKKSCGSMTWTFPLGASGTRC